MRATVLRGETAVAVYVCIVYAVLVADRLAQLGIHVRERHLPPKLPGPPLATLPRAPSARMHRTARGDIAHDVGARGGIVCASARVCRV